MLFLSPMKLIRTLALACFFILMGSSPYVCAQSAADNRFIDAIADYNEGNFKEARSALTELASIYEKDDAIFHYLGMCAMYMEDFQEAEIFLKRAVELDPGNYWYKYRLALLYSATNQPELTVNIYEDLLKDNPKKIELYYDLVNLYAQLNKPEDMLEALDNIESLSGKSEMVSLAKYETYMRTNRPEEAFKALEDYNKEFSSPQILTIMGDFRMAEYEDSAALAFYDEALSYEPGLAPALLGKAEALRIRRSYTEYFEVLNTFVSEPDIMPEAKADYFNSILRHLDGRFLNNFKANLDSLITKCTRIHPKDSTITELAGTYFYNMGDDQKAIHYLKLNAENYPQSPIIRGLYVQVLAYSGQWDELEIEAEKAFIDFPEETTFIDLKSTALYNKGDYQGVIRESERLLEMAPDDSATCLRSYSAIGDMYHSLGDNNKAYAAYKKALKINPTYAPVLNNYAYYLSLEGKSLKKAEKMSAITIEQEPDNPTYLDTYAWILFLQGRAAEAKPIFKHAMIYGGKESATILEHYAEVLEVLGEKELAKIYRNMAKDKNE